MEMLKVRLAGKDSEAWVFPSARSRAGHIVTVEKQFLSVLKKMGLDKRFVLYSARHTFGTPREQDWEPEVGDGGARTLRRQDRDALHAPGDRIDPGDY